MIFAFMRAADRKLKDDVKERWNGREFFFRRLDVWARFGTSSGMEKSPARRQFAIQLLAGFAMLVALAVLYFFAPAQWSFYPLCTFHSLTGLNCPFCGGLRATHQLLHGNFQAALALNPLFVAIVLPVLCVILVAKIFQSATGRKINLVPPRVLTWSVIGVTVAFGVLRNFPAFSWMSP
jgi:hypothetical protein